MGDEEFLKETFALFRDSAQEQMTAIAEAVKGHDAASLRDKAHSLKGSAATVGAERVASAARELERMGRDGDLAAAAGAAASLETELASACDLMRQFEAGEIAIPAPEPSRA
jgi:HPt (histidine-containing phosphotransfer) domain-containing protein